MARIRYLKPEFFEDEHLAELPYWVRLLFAGMWNIADKAGRLEDRPKKIKIKVFPYDDKIDIEEGLNILFQKKQDSERSFIIRYKVDGEKYIQIVNWDKHQKPHHTEKNSKIPAPKGMVNGDGDGDGDGECSQSKCEVKEPTKNGEITVENHNINKDKAFRYLTNESFKNLWKDWLEVRKKLKVPNTDRALNIALKKLHAEPVNIATAMLEKAIESGWKGIWPINNNVNFKTNEPKKQEKTGKYDGISKTVND